MPSINQQNALFWIAETILDRVLCVKEARRRFSHRRCPACTDRECIAHGDPCLLISSDAYILDDGAAGHFRSTLDGQCVTMPGDRFIDDFEVEAYVYARRVDGHATGEALEAYWDAYEAHGCLSGWYPRADRYEART